MSSLVLYLIRHGETDYNRQGIVQGGGVDSSLNATGIQQSQSFYRFYQQESFDALYCSPLRRTSQTLSPWQQRGLEPNPLEELIELNWGIHEGLIPTAEQKAEFLSIKQKWTEGELHLSVTGGETPLQAWERSQKAMEILFEKHQGERLLVCTHGRLLRILLSGLLDKDISRMEQYTQPNTGLHLIELTAPDKARAIKLADTAHLIADQPQGTAAIT